MRLLCFSTKMFKNTLFNIIFVSSKFDVFEHRASPEWRLCVLYKIMTFILNKSVALNESQIMEKNHLCFTFLCLHAKSERR